MIIPSIYLPITLEVFDVHFNRFFLDYTKYPDFLKYYLSRIDVGKVGFRYIIELEEQEPSTKPTPKRVINEIEALIIDDNNIEVKSSTLEPLSVFYEDWSWADNLINAFYRMINLKWNVWPSFPGVQKLEGPHDLVTDAAQVKFDNDFRSMYSHGSFPPVIYSDADEGKYVEENRAHIPGIDNEREKRWPEVYFQLIIQGLPHIEAGDEVTPTDHYQKRGPTLKTIERAKKIKEIKDNKLTLSYTQVAMKATTELGENITAEIVRNVYRAMGWKWKRGV